MERRERVERGAIALGSDSGGMRIVNPSIFPVPIVPHYSIRIVTYGVSRKLPNA